MRPYRPSIAGLLAFVAIIALGLALLRVADEFWAGVAYGLSVLFVLIAVTGAAFADRGLRAFCGGFAIFGAAYLVLAFGSFFAAADPPLAATANGGQAQPLASMTTSYLLDFLYAEQGRRPKFEAGAKVQVLWGNRYWPSAVLEAKDGQYMIHYDGHDASSDEWVDWTRMGEATQGRRHFIRVGHALLALVLGMFGGIVALAFRWTRAKRREPGEAAP